MLSPPPLFRQTLIKYAENMTDSWKLYIPKAARQDVLKENYDEMTAGHLGTTKKSARIAKKYC